MKKQISKYNYLIMSAILIVLTLTIFVIASVLSSKNDINSENEYHNNIKLSNKSSEVGVELYSEKISQSNNPNNIDTVEIEVEDDYDFPIDNGIDDSKLSVYHRGENNIQNPYNNIQNDINEEENSNNDTDSGYHQKNPDQLLFEEGRDYYIDAYYDEAIKTLRKLIRLYPSSEYVKYAEIYIGKSLIGRGEVNNNRDDYIRANELLAEDLKNYLESNDLRKNENYTEELVDFVVALSDSNRKRNIPNIEIENALEKILKITSGDSGKHIHTALGYLKMFRGDFDNAITSFKKSDSNLAYIGLSRAYLAKDEFDSALNIWIDFLDNRKKSYYYPDAFELFRINTLDYARILFDKKEYFECIKYYNIVEKYLDDTIEEEEALYFKSVALFNVQKYKDALISFNDVLLNKHYKRDSYAIFYKGKTRMEMGRSSEDELEKYRYYEVALSNLVEFTEIYDSHPFMDEAYSLIDFLRKAMNDLES